MDGGKPAAPPRRNSTAAVSARKLGAGLWEVQDLLPLEEMSRRVPRPRRGERPLGLHEDSPASPGDRPQSAGSLRRHGTTSSVRHKLNERQALQPASPATYSSSMEVAAFNQAGSPSSYLDLKGRAGESRYNLKTSTELLKVLNRIWSLEEQHASHVSLVKALKTELEKAHARIQELMQEQQSYRHEMDDLMNQVANDKVSRKNKEQDRIKAAVKSMRDELEGEKRLRRRSESLHRKLGKELCEVKASFSKAMKDLENERKTNSLLVDLCDEFAKGVGDYEQEVRELKQKTSRRCDNKTDRLVLHISEAWLDERLQLKIAEERGDMAEKSILIDRLTGEVETFLRARCSASSKNDILHQKESCLRRQSLESVHLNGAASAPQDAEDDSVASDLHCFELNMTGDSGSHDILKSHFEDGSEKTDSVRKSNVLRKKMGCPEKHRRRSSSSFEVQFDERIDRTKTCNGSKMRLDEIQGIHSHAVAETAGTESNHTEVVPQKSKNRLPQGELDTGPTWSLHGSRHLIDNSAKTHPEFSEGCSVPHDKTSWSHFVPISKDDASIDFRTLSSPVQRWNPHHISPDIEICECSNKLPEGVKENTLKAKLLEARLQGQHARLKAPKGSSFGGLRQ